MFCGRFLTVTLLYEVFCAPISNHIKSDVQVVSRYDNRQANEYDFGYVELVER